MSRVNNLSKVTQLTSGADLNPELSAWEGRAPLSANRMNGLLHTGRGQDDRAVGALERAGGPSEEGLPEEWVGLCGRCRAASPWRRRPISIHRQLSEDLLLAREALEKECQLRRQLQQEKEELLYRVLGADASPAFPLASVTPTEVSFLAS